MASQTGKVISLRDWWDDVGTDNVLKVADSIGTTMAYLRRLRYGARPSYYFAQDLIAAAQKLTMRAPTLEALLQLKESKREKVSHTPGRRIPASPAYIRAQKRVSGA